MRSRLFALAFAASLAGGSAIIFVNWDTGERVRLAPGGFEIINPDDCNPNNCNAPLCLQANNIWVDAGAACTAEVITCSFRLGAKAFAWIADAGFVVGRSPYQRARLVGARCLVDAGVRRVIPLDDDGLPQFYSFAQVTPPCVRAPLDGGLDCQCAGAMPDGGARFIGKGNTFPIANAIGTQCEPVECGVIYGDDPDVSL
jgi:hypothetical protein